MCPAGGAAAGSPLQKCMAATQTAVIAWTDYVTSCPVLRIRRRTPDARSAADGFSCFPKYDSPSEFRESFLDGETAQRSRRRRCRFGPPYNSCSLCACLLWPPVVSCVYAEVTFSLLGPCFPLPPRMADPPKAAGPSCISGEAGLCFLYAGA
ncbi:MAG: hypothetical protein J3K34DRAFT_407468 [Monoraphidium minutum]|nr:MAG: hypothetical protein J3K34DRAFT_407468 [Monoraphidium minutum]